MVFDSLDTTHPSDLMLSISMTATGVIGASGNLFLMVLILSEYKKRKPHDWLFFVLALSDFFVCVNNAALQAPFILRPQGAGCILAAAFTYSFGMISLQAPVFVSYNRYLSLYNNSLYQRLFKIRNVLIGWGIAVTMSSLLVTTFAAMDSLGKDSVGMCGLQITNSFLAAVTAACCFLTLSAYAIFAYFTHKIVLKIRQHKESVSQSAIQSTLVNESQQIIIALTFSFGLPSIAQIPSVAMIFLQLFLPPFNPWVTRAAAAAFQLAPAVNAYVITYVIKEYRKKAILVLKRPAKVAPVAVIPSQQVAETPI